MTTIKARADKLTGTMTVECNSKAIIYNVADREAPLLCGYMLSLQEKLYIPERYYEFDGDTNTPTAEELTEVLKQLIDDHSEWTYKDANILQNVFK